MEENMLISVPPAPHRDPPTTRAERLTCSSSNLTCCHFKLSCKLQCCHLGVTSCSLTIRLVLFSETLTFALFVCWFSSYFFFWATVQRIGANSVLLIHVLLFLTFPACFVFFIRAGTRAAAGCQTWKGKQTGPLTHTWTCAVDRILCPWTIVL